MTKRKYQLEYDMQNTGCGFNGNFVCHAFLNNLEGVLQETYTTVQKVLARFDKRMMASTLFYCVKEKLL